MEIKVIPAQAEQSAVMANLLELYAHDFSEFHEVHLGEDGRFGYPSLPMYWSDPQRFPFLIRIDGRLAGLALVKRGSEVSGRSAVWDMAEFFVTRGFRRHGVGMQAAHEVWRRFPGPWEVRVMQSNLSAQAFWAAAISAFVGETNLPTRFEKGGDSWSVFSFDSIASG
jgi:predicted acetyltransferase